MKQIIKLTESDLHKIVKESVKRILKEDYYSMQKPYGNRKLSDFSSEESKIILIWHVKTSPVAEHTTNES